MRIVSGVTDQGIYFVAVDETDLKTRETGLSSFTVYRSRNGAAAAAYTTPTVTELDASNMAGVYFLLLDEDMSIGSGNDSEEVVVHITASGMAPVTRVFELYRAKATQGETITSSGGVARANIIEVVGQTAAGTNMRAVFDTDFATNYDTTNDTWVVRNAGTLQTLDALDTAQDSQHATTQSAIGTVDTNVDTLITAFIGVSGTVVDGAPATTGFDTSLTDANDFWNDALIKFTSGDLAGQTRPIRDFVNASGHMDFDETWTSAPANGDAFIVISTHVHGVLQIAQSVWNSGTRTLTAATNITSTGGTTVPQTGDSFARIGATGSGLTTLATQASVDTIDGNVDLILVDTNELQADWTDGGRLDLIVDSLVVDTTQIKGDLPARITKNTALSGFVFFMTDSTDQVTGKTGLTITATRSLDGGAFASCANSASEIGNGFYKIDLASTDLNGNTVALRFTASGADDRAITLVTQPT